MGCAHNNHVCDPSAVGPPDKPCQKSVEERIQQEANLARSCSVDWKRSSTKSVELTVANVGSYNSNLEFMESSQTILIFDWDDTLCPSAWMRQRFRCNSRGVTLGNVSKADMDDLRILEQHVIQLLTLAQKLGKVVIVTNAQRPWVDMSCDEVLPNVKHMLEDIPVHYAMEMLSDGEKDRRSQTSMLTESKARAMRAAVSDFYSVYDGQSWKNVVSIGDAFYEHEAIRRVTRDRPVQKKCRTKTIKMIDSPSISGMVVQLTILTSWLANIVREDNDVEIDLSADAASVNRWINKFSDATESNKLC